MHASAVVAILLTTSGIILFLTTCVIISTVIIIIISARRPPPYKTCDARLRGRGERGKAGSKRHVSYHRVTAHLSVQSDPTPLRNAN
jgi:hypothetical protein